MEGPRPTRPEELPSLARLVDTVFASGRAGTMFGSYPQLFNEPNLDNLLVFVDDGRVVSHVGMIQRWAGLAGCRVRVACVGSVSTYEEYRDRGLATGLFEAACRKAKADGVDLMMISGGRGLYRRAGAADVGCDFVGQVGQTAADLLCDDAVVLDECRALDVAACVEAYGAKRAHFIRPESDWLGLLEARKCMGRHVRFVVARRGGVFCGYFIVADTNDKGARQVIEFAGRDNDVAGALKPLMASCEADTLKVRLQAGDAALKSLCEHAGVAFEAVNALGSLLVLNFSQLMQRLRPFFEAQAGIEATRTLVFDQEGDAFRQDDRFVFAADDGSRRLDRVAAAQFIFGQVHGEPPGGLWARLFPVPTLWYGINYV